MLSNTKITHLSKPATSQEVIQTLAEMAISEGWAKEGYGDAVWQRELQYPTGLHTVGIEVAIPHADPEWTLVPAMIVGVLSQPALFKPMGGEGGDVEASLVFLLVIPDPDSHIDFLKAFSATIEDEKIMSAFNETRQIDLLIDNLRKELEAV